MVKKILGILIFVLLGVLIIGSLVLARGWAVTLLSIIVTGVLFGLVVLGVWLLAG